MTAVRTCTWSMQHFRLTTRVTVRNRSGLSEQFSGQRAQKPRPTTDADSTSPSDDTSLTVGAVGLVLMLDAYLVKKLADFLSSRVSDRVYQFKGGGAFGYS